MKKYSGEYYDVCSIDGHIRLPLLKNETIEDIKVYINDSNRKCEALGYPPQQWIITKREWATSYNDDGEFLSRYECEKALEVYPNK